MKSYGFSDTLGSADRDALAESAVRARGNILTMTTLAASGHPGGSMSSIDLYLAVYRFANISPKNWKDTGRDRVVVSHGHTSPAVYSALAENGFFDADEAASRFRLAGSRYEGHIERMVPGVEWSTGNLGQGLSAACGMAVAGRVRGEDFQCYVFMGDGESQKGQIAEARRFAVKYRLNNITAFIDYNCLQISGDICDVMPQNLKDEYIADGWVVLEVDGHDFTQIYNAIGRAHSIDRPVMILARTVMSKGVSFMENKAGYHGAPLSAEDYDKAMKELGLEPKLDTMKKLRNAFVFDKKRHEMNQPAVSVKPGKPRDYAVDKKTDNRSAFGNALLDLVHVNDADTDSSPIVVFDCDLAGSVKTAGVEKEFPEKFFQAGIQEHHTATMAGAASVNGVVPFFADFGVFGVDESYNQQRLNDINHASLKLVTTHVGIDVGEDGRTHQCIDYVGAMRNMFGFKVIVPGDPNQTDRATRFAATTDGNVYVAMGRSKLPTIVDEAGNAMFGGDYAFEYGQLDIVRTGDVNIFSYGTMLHRAIEVSDMLKEKGLNVGVVNVSCPVHPDVAALKPLLASGNAFTYEDHHARTGLFATIAGVAAEEGIPCRVTPFGVEQYSYSGKPDDIFTLIGLAPEQVAEKIEKRLK